MARRGDNHDEWIRFLRLDDPKITNPYTDFKIKDTWGKESTFNFKNNFNIEMTKIGGHVTFLFGKKHVLDNFLFEGEEDRADTERVTLTQIT